MEATGGADGVADARWARVRELAGRAERLEAADRLGELDEEGRARLDRLRLKAARAIDSARLADELADRLNGIARSRRSGRGAPDA
jgi:hypothetical protein